MSQAQHLRLRMVAGVAIALASTTVRKDQVILVDHSDKDRWLNRTTVVRDQTVNMFAVDTTNDKINHDFTTAQRDVAAEEAAKAEAEAKAKADADAAEKAKAEAEAAEKAEAAAKAEAEKAEAEKAEAEKTKTATQRVARSK